MSDRRQYLRLVPPAPFNSGRALVSLPQLKRQYKSLKTAVPDIIPKPVLDELAKTKWQLHFTALPTDHKGEQKTPRVADADDGRAWDDQIGGACNQYGRSLYVALFWATNNELTKFARHSEEALIGIFRHEVGHAFGKLLADLVERSRWDCFSVLSKPFMDAVWQDTIAAGGVGTLRARGYGYYTPGDVRFNRHLYEVFAEGMAIIWGGGCHDNTVAFRNIYPRSMGVLQELNDKFCATDFSNPESRDAFVNFLSAQISAPSLHGTFINEAESIIYNRSISLPFYSRWQHQNTRRPGKFYDTDDLIIGKVAQLFAQHPRSRFYGPHGKITSLINEYEQIHNSVYATGSYRWRDYRKIREIVNEITTAYAPGSQIDKMTELQKKSIADVAADYDDLILKHYLACERKLGDTIPNKIERLLFARAVNDYADLYRAIPANDDDVDTQRLYLRQRREALTVIQNIVNAISMDNEGRYYSLVFQLFDRYLEDERQNIIGEFVNLQQHGALSTDLTGRSRSMLAKLAAD